MSENALRPRMQFSHLGITCFDIGRMEDFYTRLLGFTVTDRGGLPGVSIVFMTLDPNEHHQLVLLSGRTESAGTTDRPFGGGRGSAINQISLRLRDLDELRRLHARLRAEGYDNMAPINHGIAWSVYVCDPENNALELFVDSDWYIVQPCAEELDLSLSDEELKRRTEEFCRRQPGFEPYSAWKARMAARMAAGN
jgi:catechol 2,3-dioxygenase